MVNITQVNLTALATSLLYSSTINNIISTANSSLQFVSYNKTFTSSILGPNVSQRLIAERSYQFVHEAGIYLPSTNKVYIASNYISLDNPINVTTVDLSDYSITEVQYPDLIMANGGCPYQGKALFCAEGSLEKPSSLTLVDPLTNETTILIDNFLGRQFNSLNDIKLHNKTGDIWFTDAQYGYFQNFRPKPTIPNQVYRFNPSTGVVQVVADGFEQSNGIEFSPDYLTLYITDTGAMTTSMDPLGAATIYAFDVVHGKFLRNKRLFAYSDVGFPDGIHTDSEGNVYASCGDGVHVWNVDGVLLGKILVDGGSNNFAFVPDGILVFNGNKLYLAKIAARGRDVGGT